RRGGAGQRAARHRGVRAGPRFYVLASVLAQDDPRRGNAAPGGGAAGAEAGRLAAAGRAAFGGVPGFGRRGFAGGPQDVGPPPGPGFVRFERAFSDAAAAEARVRRAARGAAAGRGGGGPGRGGRGGV